MNEENTKKLFEEFPELYRGRHLGMQKNLMCFGFECGDGWYDLVRELSSKIMEFCGRTNEEIPGVFQVKEKFGTLRFYINSGSKEIHELIDEYERKSAATCENTGEPGSLCSRKGWMKTLCPEEARKEGYARIKRKDES